MNMMSEIRGAGLVERAREVAAVAAKYADVVDKEGRFPHEAVAAMKSARLFGIQIPIFWAARGQPLPRLPSSARSSRRNVRLRP